MSSRPQEADLVARFSRVMSQKLRENSHKEHWSGLTPGMCLRRISQELGELRRAVKRGASAKDIAREAADVANFAAFLADNCAGLEGEVTP